MDLDDFLWFGLVCHVPNIDLCNNFLKYLWHQLLNIRIPANRGIYFPPLHTPCQSPNLLQNIWIQHFVVNNVGLWTFVRAAVVVGAEVDIHLPILEPLSGQCQRMTAAIAEQ